MTNANDLEAFLTGFNRAAVMSPREAITALEERGLESSDSAVAMFLNGCDDGLAGDRFRVSYVLASLPPTLQVSAKFCR